MSDRRCLGRDQELSTIFRSIEKSTPDNLQVVGPKLIGKTTLLRTALETLKAKDEWHLVYFDFDTESARSDEDFWVAYATMIDQALRDRDKGNPAAGVIELAPERINSEISTFFDVLGSEKIKLLTVFDHFDRVVQRDISQNTWAKLRHFASEYRDCVTWTGSRRSLSDICFSTEMKGSQFWNVFNPEPLRLSRVDDKAISFWVSDLEQIAAVEEPARKEITNWTGGVPVLLEELCSRLKEQSQPSQGVSKEQVDSIAKQVTDSSENVRAIWLDCDTETQQDLFQASSQPLSESEIGRERADQLSHRGLASRSGGQLKSTCRIMGNYASIYGQQVTNLEQSFRDVESFDENIGKVLLLRLKTIRKRHGELYEYLERAIQGLNEPDLGLVFSRKIRNSALSIIWSFELDEEEKIPKDVADYWLGRVNETWDIFGDIKNRTIPQTASDQLRLLDWLTGTHTFKKMSKCLSKSTLVALNHIHELGNYDNHAPEGEPRSMMFGASHCLSALTILENLTEDQ
jgi:hypothetical protein